MPGGRTAPASSTTRSATPGKGWPTVPGFVAGLADAVAVEIGRGSSQRTEGGMIEVREARVDRLERLQLARPRCSNAVTPVSSDGLTDGERGDRRR